MLDMPTITIPLHTDEHGAIRVSGTRVTLDVLINYYLQGETPEDLHEGFPTVPLTDIYAVITYYLANKAEVDAYLARRRAEAAHIRENGRGAVSTESDARGVAGAAGS
jgi:uncharacterized protein (DUF433 family)